jgi:uncharacterized lipoprotein YmbA
MTHRAAVAWLAVASCAALAGCSAFAPRTDPSHFYFLAPLAPDAAPPAGGGAALAVGLADIRFPPYLERPELATRVAANELHFSDMARWAEPLGAGFARVLAVDLDAQLGAASVVRSPWYPAARLDCVLAVEVDHFELEAAAGGGGEVVLVARWSIRDGLGRKVLRSGTSIHRRPAGRAGNARTDQPGAAAAAGSPAMAGAPDAAGEPGEVGGPAAGVPAPSPAAVVAALSQLIEDFSREMAAAVRRAVPGVSPGGG